jgi:hypothetical protein
MKSNLVSNVSERLPRPMKPVLIRKHADKSYIVLTIPALYLTDARQVAGVVVWTDEKKCSLKVGEYSHSWLWDNFEELPTSKSVALANE